MATAMSQISFSPKSAPVAVPSSIFASSSRGTFDFLASSSRLIFLSSRICTTACPKQRTCSGRSSLVIEVLQAVGHERKCDLEEFAEERVWQEKRNQTDRN